jgi:thiamine kinase-like enzyme
MPIAPKALGMGTQGIAFDIGNDKALKITEDLSEAKVAEQIKNKDIRGVYKTFGAYKFTSKPTKKQTDVLEDLDIQFEITNVSFVIMEKLDKNNARAKKIDRMIDILQDDYSWIFVNNDKWTEERLTIFLNNKHLLDDIEEAGDKQLKKDIIELAYGLTNLKTLGIHYGDLHGGNILFNSKGKAVIIDIGYSTGGKSKPIVFEGIL